MRRFRGLNGDSEQDERLGLVAATVFDWMSKSRVEQTYPSHKYGAESRSEEGGRLCWQHCMLIARRVSRVACHHGFDHGISRHESILSGWIMATTWRVHMEETERGNVWNHAVWKLSCFGLLLLYWV
jgi:hypothetical protein